jgi:hypothetical protein
LTDVLPPIDLVEDVTADHATIAFSSELGAALSKLSIKSLGFGIHFDADA